MSQSRHPRSLKIIAVTTLVTFIASCLPYYAYAAQAIPPNLMIVFGNSFSMNRELDDTSYPNVTPLHFNDISYGGLGTEFPYPLYGDQKTSKLYIAKQALSSVLDSDTSSGINIGFATFRQIYGMEAASTAATVRGTWPVAIPNDPTMLTGSATTQQKTDYGKIPANFKYIDWYRIWVSGNLNRNMLLGKNIHDYGKGVIDDAQATYMTGISNGLPTKIIYKPGPTLAYDLDPITGNAIYSPTTTIHDQTYTDSSASGYGPLSVFNGSGATGNLQTVTATNPLATWRLCYTYYDSQQNNFFGFYLSDKDVIDSYPSLYGAYSLYFVDWNNIKFGSSGFIDRGSYQQYCIGFNDTYRETAKRIANTYKHNNERVWFSGIPDYYAGMWDSQFPLAPGVLSGWSGETTYTETDNSKTTGVTTANYPSGAADPNRNDRQLRTQGTLQTQIKHMGVFLDLPPSSGYVDQRNTIKGFMGLQQMNQSGEDYDPNTQIIADGKGIAVSTYAYDGHQSPIYDSLSGALAYFTAYKAQDTYKNCRSNNILLFFDGKEDAHWIDENGSPRYVSPAEIAAKLEAIGVKTYVVILSNNDGDIQAANEIASAGGTKSAYTANSAVTLLSAFQKVFSGLTGAAKATAAPIMPPQVGSGGKLYQANYSLSPVAGHLNAYSFTYTGFVDNTPLWDAAALMTPVNRTQQLLSNDSSGAIVSFNALDSAAFAASASPSVADIKNYTIDPSFGGGAYLSGRASGSLMGIYGDNSMTPLLMTPPSNVSLSYDANYVTYKQNQANRQSSVLIHNDDGFLYSFDANNGALLWGWMPRELVSKLSNFTSFWSAGHMKGGAVIADAPIVGTTNYATYVLGTAEGGALHYALALKNDANSPPHAYPDQVVWTNAVAGATSPAAQAPVVTYITSSGINAGYANYITTVGSVSTLYVHKIGTGEVASTAVLPFTPSSDLVHDNGFFYVGDTAGAVWKMPVSSTAQAIVDAKQKVGDTYNNQPVKFLGIYQYSGVSYVWASGVSGITAFGYTVDSAGTKSWKRLWESHAGGSGSWDATGVTYTADANPVTMPTAAKVQMLPAGATITARAALVKDALLLPVLVPDASDPCAAGKGYLYLYSIENGFKPLISIYKINADDTKTVTSGNLVIGLGAVMEAILATSSSGTVIQASANQRLDGTIGPESFGVPADSASGKSGLVSWRELAN